jgi:hypothetical protein
MIAKILKSAGRMAARLILAIVDDRKAHYFPMYDGPPSWRICRSIQSVRRST